MFILEKTVMFPLLIAFQILSSHPTPGLLSLKKRNRQVKKTNQEPDKMNKWINKTNKKNGKNMHTQTFLYTHLTHTHSIKMKTKI